MLFKLAEVTGAEKIFTLEKPWLSLFL